MDSDKKGCREIENMFRFRVREEKRVEFGANRRPRALVLFSGGLDSMLAIKLLQKQGIEVEAVHFLTPFSCCDEQFVDGFCKDLDVRLHKIFLGKDFLKIVSNPTHGYGSQVNPCVDCRILMLREAQKLAEKISVDFLATGEVLNERPFSQRKDALSIIDKKAGLEGRILRPLSAKVLPETEPERKGFVKREELSAVCGRRRVVQMELAKAMSLKDYPNPAGGCLLTESRFAERLREHLKFEKTLTLMHAELLTTGRHFRINKLKIVVGRNMDENKKLLLIGQKHKLAKMEIVDYMSPLTVLLGKKDEDSIMKAACITARYSDAPKENIAIVRYEDKEKQHFLTAKPMEESKVRSFMI